MKISSLLSLSSLFLTGLLVSCVSGGPPPPNPAQTKALRASFVNPHPKGSYAYFKASPSYPKTSRTYKSSTVLSQTNSSNSRIVIDLAKQRAFLKRGDEIAIDYPISSGKRKYRTPKGSFTILEKMKDKRSNTYGKIYNASGGLVKGNADRKKDKVPPGGKYVGASMPYWMRMTWDGIGHHVGRVPRYAASHGCIRGQRSNLRTIFSKVRIGTPVTVQ